MYRDTEQSYGDYTLDVFESADGVNWICSWWARSDPGRCGKTVNHRRKEAIRLAKEEIDRDEN